MGTTNVSAFWADTGGKACADDAKVRARATAISRSIGSLPFVLISWPALGREAVGEPMAPKTYIVSTMLETGRGGGPFLRVTLVPDQASTRRLLFPVRAHVNALAATRAPPHARAATNRLPGGRSEFHW